MIRMLIMTLFFTVISSEVFINKTVYQSVIAPKVTIYNTVQLNGEQVQRTGVFEKTREGPNITFATHENQPQRINAFPNTTTKYGNGRITMTSTGLPTGTTLSNPTSVDFNRNRNTVTSTHVISNSSTVVTINRTIPIVTITAIEIQTIEIPIITDTITKIETETIRIDYKTVIEIKTETIPVITNTATEIETETIQINYTTAYFTDTIPIITNTVTEYNTKSIPLITRTETKFSTEIIPIVTNTIPEISTESIPIVTNTITEISTEIIPIVTNTITEISTEIIPIVTNTITEISTEIIPIVTNTVIKSTTQTRPVFTNTIISYSTKSIPIITSTVLVTNPISIVINTDLNSTSSTPFLNTQRLPITTNTTTMYTTAIEATTISNDHSTELDSQVKTKLTSNPELNEPQNYKKITEKTEKLLSTLKIKSSEWNDIDDILNEIRLLSEEIHNKQRNKTQ